MLDDTMNVRLSYQDMRLFLAIWESLPTNLKSKPTTDGVVVSGERAFRIIVLVSLVLKGNAFKGYFFRSKGYIVYVFVYVRMSCMHPNILFVL